MNLDELQSVRDSERRTDSLQQLRESFYADAGEFIQELREKRDRAAERADDPFDAPEVDRLTSEIKAAEETVEAIYEKRLGKLVKAASLAAAEMPAGTEGLTTEEQQLFDTLVEDIKANRQHVLDVLAGDGTEPTDDADPTGIGEAGGESTRSTDSGSGSATSERTDQNTGASDRQHRTDTESTAGTVDAAEAMGESGHSRPSSRGESPAADDPPTSVDSESNRGVETNQGTTDTAQIPQNSTGESEASESHATNIDRERVRITADVGAIFGVDEREYDLSENDVVQLPRENAKPLLERDAAERL